MKLYGQSKEIKENRGETYLYEGIRFLQFGEGFFQRQPQIARKNEDLQSTDWKRKGEKIINKREIYNIYIYMFMFMFIYLSIQIYYLVKHSSPSTNLKLFPLRSNTSKERNSLILTWLSFLLGRRRCLTRWIKSLDRICVWPQQDIRLYFHLVDIVLYYRR